VGWRGWQSCGLNNWLFIKYITLKIQPSQPIQPRSRVRGGRPSNSLGDVPRWIGWLGWFVRVKCLISKGHFVPKVVTEVGLWVGMVVAIPQTMTNYCPHGVGLAINLNVCLSCIKNPPPVVPPPVPPSTFRRLCPDFDRQVDTRERARQFRNSIVAEVEKRPFDWHELAWVSGFPKYAVRKLMRRMVERGLLDEKSAGRTRVYRKRWAE